MEVNEKPAIAFLKCVLMSTLALVRHLLETPVGLGHDALP